MLRLLLVGLQVTTLSDAAEMPASPPLDLHAVRRCPTGQTGDDVVVCGAANPDRYRLKPLPSGFERDGKPPLAQTGVGGGTLGVTTQQVMIGNVPSNRVMLSLKLPF